MGGELQHVTGHRLDLRLVQPDDAEYVFALRNDPTYNAHLSPVSGTVEDQRRWIEAYKTRETAGTEAYFVIERREDGCPCGLVRLYGIEADQFTWGSWILDANKPAKAALESTVLIYTFGFDVLRKRLSVFDVRRQNERTLAFHKRFGALETGSDALNLYFKYSAEQFLTDRPRHWRAIAAAGEFS